MREIISATFKTGASSFLALLFSVITVKIFAVIIGTIGVGQFSLLKQTHQTALIIGTFGGQTALIQGIASLKNDDREQYLKWTLFFLSISSFITILFFLFFSSSISSLIFGNVERSTIEIVKLLSIPILFGVIFNYLTSIINGFQAIGRLALVQIIMAAISAIFAYPVSLLVKRGNQNAYIILMSLSFLSGICISLYFILKQKWLKNVFYDFKFRYLKKSFTHFFSLSGTTVITSFIGTGALLGLRAIIVHRDGYQGVGVFDVSWTLSMAYVTIILTSFGTYYLPKLSGLISGEDRVLLIQRFLKISTQLMIPLIVFVIVFKPLIINLLYSLKFSGSLKIIRWMLIGDYLKVTSWVLAMPMIAFPDMKTYFWIEIILNITLFCIASISIYLLNDLQGVGVGFVLIYALNFTYSLFYTRKKHHFPINKTFFLPWVIGLILICCVSWVTWNQEKVVWWSSLIWIGVATMFSWFNLNREERAKAVYFILNPRLILRGNS